MKNIFILLFIQSLFISCQITEVEKSKKASSIGFQNNPSQDSSDEKVNFDVIGFSIDRSENSQRAKVSILCPTGYTMFHLERGGNAHIFKTLVASDFTQESSTFYLDSDNLDYYPVRMSCLDKKKNAILSADKIIFFNADNKAPNFAYKTNYAESRSSRKIVEISSNEEFHLRTYTSTVKDSEEFLKYKSYNSYRGEFHRIPIRNCSKENKGAVYYTHIQVKDKYDNESEVLTVSSYLEAAPKSNIGGFRTIPMECVYQNKFKRARNTDWNNLLTILGSPASSNDFKIFDSYPSKTSTISWNSKWLGAFNFSGIAWDIKQAGTLISYSHIILADHYSRGVGTTIIFHDNNGNPHSRKIAKSFKIEGGRDIRMLKLDRPLPTSFKTYPIFEPLGEGINISIDYSDFPLISTRQTKKFDILDFEGQPRIDLPDYYSSAVYSGDSGNPSFYFYNNQLVLKGTHISVGSNDGVVDSNLSIRAAFEEILEKIQL